MAKPPEAGSSIPSFDRTLFLYLVVQQQVQLDRPLRPLILRPVEHAYRQVDDAPLQTHQLVLKTELLLPPALARHQILALAQRLVEHRLVVLRLFLKIGR